MLDQAETPAQLPPGVAVGVAVVVEVAGRVEVVDGTGVLLEDDAGSDAPPQALTVGKIFSSRAKHNKNSTAYLRSNPRLDCVLAEN